MTREEILSHVDHTLLKPEATWPQIQTLCDEAIANHTASVCINTCYVKPCWKYIRQSVDEENNAKTKEIRGFLH